MVQGLLDRLSTYRYRPFVMPITLSLLLSILGHVLCFNVSLLCRSHTRCCRCSSMWRAFVALLFCWHSLIVAYGSLRVFYESKETIHF